MDVDSRYLKQARWAAQEFGLEDDAVFHEMQVYDLAYEESKFDLVLFMGVFYHLRYPLLGLDIVARRTRPAPLGTPRCYDFTPELRSATGRRWR